MDARSYDSIDVGGRVKLEARAESNWFF